MTIIAYPGLIAEIDCIPKYWRGPAMRVTVEGFLSGPGREVLNLRHYQRIPKHDAAERLPAIVLTAGTSAETGKTTLVCSLIRTLLVMHKGIRIGAVKACGTGRTRDSDAYYDAGASRVVDFVDAGWPSTYGIPVDTYRHVLRDMIAHAGEAADVLFVEVGGDLLEGRAPEALKELLPFHPIVAFCVNDAMGAVAGIDIFSRHGVDQVFVSSFKQNPFTLARRLSINLVVDSMDTTSVRIVADKIIEQIGLNQIAAHERTPD